MKQAEIDLVRMWIACRDRGECTLSSVRAWTDRHFEAHGEAPFKEWAGFDPGLMKWAPYPGVVPDPEIFNPRKLVHPRRDDAGAYVLTPKGSDLVASYEAAVAQGLPIVADDEPVIDASYEFDAPDPCPDCEDGFVGIPVEYGSQGGIIRVWPATCPTCSGSKVVARRSPSSLDAIRQLHHDVPTRSDDRVDELPAFLRPTQNDPRALEWRQLTRAEAEKLVGREIEVQGIDGTRFCDKVGASMLFAYPGAFNLDGSWWVRPVEHPWVTEPEAIDELLQSCISEDRIEVKWTDSGHQQSASGVGFAPDRVEWQTEQGWALGDDMHTFIMRVRPGEDTIPVITAVRRVVP